MLNGNASPLNPPPGWDMGTAQVCSFVVNVACDMCEQWKAAGQPGIGDFNWQANDSCAYTSSAFNVNDYIFSGPIWSHFTFLNRKISEPFAVLAQPASDPTTFYLAFRGSQTDADLGMDLEFDLVNYHPPTMSSIADIKVEQGFYQVFKGLDHIAMAEVFRQVAGVVGGGKLIVTGHSLGSTLATLTVPLACSEKIPSGDILQYNQASPKVGDSNFQAYYESLGVQTFRLVNTYDIVPDIPPGPYKAVGLEAAFGAEYPTKLECHNPCCSYSYALFNPSAPYNPAIGTCMDTSKPELRIP